MKRGTNIFLVGLAGCGKSTVGSLLAQSLERSFLDTDREVERLAGMALEEIFHAGGQAHFRRLEWQVLSAIRDDGQLVVALGATAFLSAPHRQLVRERGLSVWLDVPFAELWHRLEKLGQTRQAERRRLEKNFQRRREIYALADRRLRAGGLSPQEVVLHIKDLLE